MRRTIIITIIAGTIVVIVMMTAVTAAHMASSCVGLKNTEPDERISSGSVSSILTQYSAVAGDLTG